MEISIGYKFMPTDEELCWYLYNHNVVFDTQGFIIPINVDNIYDDPPWKLNWTHVVYLQDYERYYFSKRISVSKNSKGKNTKREVESSEEFHGGYWNATSTRDIKDSQNQLIGHKKTLKFYAYKDKKKIRKEADPTAYIMHEYYLPSDHTFQDLILCRIKNLDAERKKDRQPINHHTQREPKPDINDEDRDSVSNIDDISLANDHTQQEPEPNINYKDFASFLDDILQEPEPNINDEDFASLLDDILQEPEPEINDEDFASLLDDILQEPKPDINDKDKDFASCLDNILLANG